MTEKNFKEIDNLKIEGFNPNEYAQPYDENPDESYLPYEIQRWWFNTLYPNGRIMVTTPQPDPERTPGAYVATATIWKDKNDEKEDICISNRAVVSETSTVDPYQDCQRKAISLALKTLGFWLTPSKIVKKPMVNPEEVGISEEAAKSVVPETTEPVEKTEDTEKTETPVPPAEQPKKRGRKPKNQTATEEKDSNTESQEEVKLEEKESEAATEKKVEEIEETATSDENSTEETTENSVTKETSTVNESTMSLEEARNTVVSYRTFAGRTIGELFDSGVQKDHELLVWFATSSRAKDRYEKEVEAAKVVLANE